MYNKYVIMYNSKNIETNARNIYMTPPRPLSGHLSGGANIHALLRGECDAPAESGAGEVGERPRCAMPMRCSTGREGDVQRGRDV